MAAALPPGSFVARSLCCDRLTGPRFHSGQTRGSAAATQGLNTSRASVRPASISCQACTPSDAPESDHNTGLNTSQFRAGPSGSAGTNSNVGGDPELSSGSGDDQQHQPPRSGQPGNGPPVVTSDSLGTVVICGWLGSNKRYLKKYQDWWTDNG